jgi:predicted HTH domain antitoxin
MNELHVTFPKSLEITLNKSESGTVSTIKEIVALHLYRNGTISLGKAGEIMGLSKQEMPHLLSIRRIPINYDVDDLKSDLKTLDRVLG